MYTNKSIWANYVMVTRPIHMLFCKANTLRQLAINSTTLIIYNTLLLYDYYCMSNLIGPLLGNILPYCTGTGGYCTVRVVVMETSHRIKKNCSASWRTWADLWGWLSNFAWFCLLQGMLCSLYSSEIQQKRLGSPVNWLPFATRSLVN